MKTFRLKCKHNSGQCVIDTLTEESSLDDLINDIVSKTGSFDSSVSLKSGFPPKPLNTSDKSRTLKSAGVRSGDTILAVISNNEVASKSLYDKVNSKSSVTASAPPSWTQNLSDFLGNHNQLLTRRTVPANNSCLFTSINLCLNNGKMDLSCAPAMRRIIVQCVKDNPIKYNAAVLGMDPEIYCSKIIKDDQWGGGIELDILSKFYQIEIDVVDTQTIRIDRFGEDENYPERILVIYDGIHYDPLAMEQFDIGSEGNLQTRYPNGDDTILKLALGLAKEAQSSRQFTDVAHFKIKCMDCDVYLSGEKEAQEHATSTRHTNFQEV